MTTLPKRAKPKTVKRTTARARVTAGVAVQGNKNTTASERSVVSKNARNIITGNNNLVIEYLEHGGEVRDKKTLNRQITSYLQWVEEAYRELRMSGIRRGPDPVLQVPIDEIYLPLQAVPARDGARAGKDGNLLAEGGIGPEPKPIRLDDMFELGKRIVVIGGPGSGKSTVLMRFAWELAQAHLQGKSKTPLLGLPAPLPLPIYAPLAGYNDHRRNVEKRAGHALADLSLKAYLSEYLAGMEGNFKLPPDFFERLLSSGRSLVLLLDGLDEIAVDTERHMVRAEIEKLIVGKADTHIVVTCRPAGYDEDSQLAREFRKVSVLPLDTPQVGRLARKYYGYVERGRAQSADKLTDELMDGIEKLENQRHELDADAPPLIDSPLMVRMILIVHVADQKMPEQRAQLFKRVTETIVQSDHQQLQDVKQLLGRQISGNPETDYEMIQYLAYQMHARGKGAGRDIAGEALLNAFAGTRYAAHALALQAHAAHRGGLLEKRGNAFRFTHLSLQEFLTARYLATVTLGEGGIEGVAGFLEAERAQESWWREVALLIPGYFVATSNAMTAVSFLRRLSGLTRPASTKVPSADVRLATAELCATAARELLGTDADLKTALADLLRHDFEDGAVMADASAQRRALAGVALGKLGDPRDEVMRVDAMRFCVVPAGPFCMGSQDDPDAFEDESPADPNYEMPYAYAIGQYPITNAQFKTFCDEDGYENEKWWTVARGHEIWRDGKVLRRVYRYVDEQKERIAFRVEEGADAPADFGNPFNLPNHPVVGITWHEALAFTKWLTNRWRGLGWLTSSQAVHLPNEPEWEKAARGGLQIPVSPLTGDAASISKMVARDPALAQNPAPWRKYPQTNADLGEMINFDKSGIGTTSACGAFPSGASVYGCQDLSGNVWEYTRSAWGNWDGKSQMIENAYAYPYVAGDGREEEDLGREMSCVLRGGSCGGGARDARCAFRDRYLPDYWDDNVGFRVVVSPFPSSG